MPLKAKKVSKVHSITRTISSPDSEELMVHLQSKKLMQQRNVKNNLEKMVIKRDNARKALTCKELEK